jgi:predicted Zn-dependent protease
MSNRIITTLNDLRQYALSRGYVISILFHEEDNALMRFANSAISLNTSEHLVRLEITAYEGRKRATYQLITDLSRLDEMKQGIDTAAEMVGHAQPLNYQPTIPVFTESFQDESCFDPDLAALSSEDRLEYFNQLAAELETPEIKLSGIFSNGTTTFAQVNTRSEHYLYTKLSDAQITAVLSHSNLKWEVTAEQSAQKVTDLDPAALHVELACLVKHYLQDAPQQLPLGSYNIVFGSAAIADLLNFMNWIGFDGGLMKRGFSFLKEENVGQKVLSKQVTLIDDPSRRETFPFQRDFTGILRRPFPIVQAGIFKGFTWSQDEADEFNATVTGHTLPHKSLVFAGGSQPVKTLEDLIQAPRESDLLYFPFLHYANIVNPSKGVITGSSRFGCLLLKKDGRTAVPYNVRITLSLMEIFGDKIAWLSQSTIPYNTSVSYGSRNPTAMIVPCFMQVNDLAISHSNSSY